MLLFGMINWTFTWLKPGGTLDHDAIGAMVSQLFFGGVRAVSVPEGKKPRKSGRA
jgi:TetR/AcrR family transcriptional regulator